MLSWCEGTLEWVQKCKLPSNSHFVCECMKACIFSVFFQTFFVNVHNNVRYSIPSNVNIWRGHIWHMVCIIKQQQKKKNMNDKLQVHSNSIPVTHTGSTWDWMQPHTITNNCLHSLKDFPRQKCLPYQYCPLLPPLPAVLWYHIWPLCAQGDFQPLKRWAGWEWASDLWAAFSLTMWE